ncbi:hypothetical protein GCM10007863_17170 [Dyella mobilis]|nr:hypothetical protein GCM10007863_17170 [Dyella mobilis]
MRNACAGNERLGWHAACVDAGTADEMAFYQCHRHAGICQATCQGWSCLSGADDDRIKSTVHAAPFGSLNERYLTGEPHYLDG